MRYTSIMYHKIEDPTSTKSSVTSDNFKKQVSELKRLSVNSYIPGETISSHNSCFITFDDGHKSNYRAAEILKENGLLGCFYVVKDFAYNNHQYLDGDEIRAIADMGHVIGVHGKVHTWWTRFDNYTLAADLLETKKWIEDLTGKAVLHCSAPGGVLNKRVIDCIRNNIPDMAYIRSSKFGSNKDNNTLLNCIAINRDCDMENFRRIVIYNPTHYAIGSIKYNIKEIIKPIYHFVKR